MPNNSELKSQIQQALNNFQTEDFISASLNFWKTLGYESERCYEKRSYTFEEFRDSFSSRHEIRPDKALKDHWSKINILFQMTSEEINTYLSHSAQEYVPGCDFGGVESENIKSYLFANIEIKPGSYTRTQYATLTREINRCFAMPVLLLIKCESKLTLCVIYRRRNKRDSERDVLEKVTQIKDISLGGIAHRAHIEILFDLTLSELARKQTITDFDSLHRAWENTLSAEALSNTFYKELRNWYLWTVKSIRFPQIVPPDDEIPDAEHQKISAIRLLTRFMFCWFLKEKQGLVPETLFDPRKLTTVLKDFNPLGDESSYYQAILQNLFFATLSVPMHERRFIADSEYQGYNPDYGDSKVFRYHDLFQDQALLEKLFSSIPFLNGGLFDCLDKPRTKDKDPEIRLDGFSKRIAKRAQVPNKLFWGNADIDLSQELGGSSNKCVTVLGLITIFENYKFTVEENTPIDEEIALDPTLLGKAFEELLAYYNPETNEAAKNQTGSFYTPPLISEYMIDKSLRIYLHDYLSTHTKMTAADIEVGLDILLSYTEKEHAFTLGETKALVRALDECKVIDPACGSGAFLMGILHKMVYILQKVDHNNKIWFDLLIENFPSHLKDEMRTKLATENHTYNRKLGLIQKCIYGVDIQPIAIQIAKLRFFLTLLIEQDIDLARAQDNYNFLPLPNLDFKLICSDTLLRFQSQLTDTEQDQSEIELENPRMVELREAVNDYFSASLPKLKKQIVQRIKIIINEVAEAHIRTIETKLHKIHYESDARKKKILQSEISRISFEKDQWLSYHGIFDNRTVLFFEPQFQFPDIQDGFDIVIGNPPYIQLQSAMIRTQTELYQHMGYRSFERTGDIYCLFYERGLDILKKGGTICYITSNKWMRSKYGRSLRELLYENTTIYELIDMHGYKVFSSATVDTNIITLKKIEFSSDHQISFVNIGEDFSVAHFYDYLLENASNLKQKRLNPNGWTFADSSHLLINSKIEKLGNPLSKWELNIFFGIKTGYNKAFIIDSITKDRLCREDPKSKEVIKPLLRGRNIRRYKYEWAGLWLIALFPAMNFDINEYPAIKRYLMGFGKKLYQTGQPECRKRTNNKWYETQDTVAYHKEYEKVKIIYPKMTKYLPFAIDNKGMFTNDKCFIITSSTDILIPLVGVLNSKLIYFYIKKTFPELQGGTRELNKDRFEKLPIIESITRNPQLKSCINKLLTLIEKNDSNSDITQPPYKCLLEEIDALVYSIYGLTENEIRIVEDFYEGQ